MRVSTLILLTCLISPWCPALADDWVLRMDGIGPLRIGMHFDEANASVGQRLVRGEPEMGPSPGCGEIELPMRPGISLMFIDDVLKRIDVFAAGTKTDKHISVGDTAARVLAAYPKVDKQAHFYDSRERYLTVFSADRQFALRFETHQSKIAHFYAGAAEQVRYVEGCL